MKRTWAILTALVAGFALLTTVVAQDNGFPGNVAYAFTSPGGLKGDIWFQQGGSKISGVMLMNFDRDDLNDPGWGFSFTGSTIQTPGGGYLVRMDGVPGQQRQGRYPNHTENDPPMILQTFSGALIFQPDFRSGQGPFSLTFANVPSDAVAEWPARQQDNVTVGASQNAPSAEAIGLFLGGSRITLRLTDGAWSWFTEGNATLDEFDQSSGRAVVHTPADIQAVSFVRLEDGDGLEFAQLIVDRSRNRWQVTQPTTGVAVRADGQLLGRFTEGTLFNPAPAP